MQLLALATSACTVAPSEVPDREHLVLVKSVRLPNRDWLPWYTRFADHCWVDFKDGRGWWRAEWNKHTPEVQVYHIAPEVGRADVRWEMCVQVHSVTGGAAAERVGQQIHRRAASYPHQGNYQAFPGPNSNTFVAWLARECGIRVELPPTAFGEHYVGIAGAGVTTTGTGVALDTYAFGVEIGLSEGAGVHVFGLPFGVALWPPAVKLPFLPSIPFGFYGRGSAE